MNEEVILVNEKDEATGHMEKLLAHQQGLLHRAFSIFIFNDQRELLLQQRAFGKYHSGGLWTNTCCSHPAPGEDTMQAASRRLQEEMGFNTSLQPLFTFTYKAILDRGLTEHEVDHVFTGVYNGPVLVNAEEAAAYQWIGEEALSAAVSAHPEAYTVWFRQVYQRVWRFIDASSSF